MSYETSPEYDRLVDMLGYEQANAAIASITPEPVKDADALLELAMGIICNASNGNLEQEDPEWTKAARRWLRDYTTYVRTQRNAGAESSEPALTYQITAEDNCYALGDNDSPDNEHSPDYQTYHRLYIGNGDKSGWTLGQLELVLKHATWKKKQGVK